MPIPIWAGRYIGLPFKDHGRDRAGLDCWGLVRLVLAEQFSIAVPSFATEYRRTTDMTGIAAIVTREQSKWRVQKPGDEKSGDVIVLRLRGRPVHVGIVIGDGYMLHIENGINSAIESYRGACWANRINGFYRHDRYDHSFTL